MSRLRCPSSIWLAVAAMLAAALIGGCGESPAMPSPDTERDPDVLYVPTPQPVVELMLEMAAVGADDVVYDLGSGDGRIPVTAARRWGARAVGIEIDRRRIDEANRNAAEAGVTDQVRFIHGDLFEADLSEATVISLSLLPSVNMRLRPTLQRLAPGTRIVSHNFSMGDWLPERTERLGSSTVYMWTVR
jgi:precorrin-6B methylase 2